MPAYSSPVNNPKNASEEKLRIDYLLDREAIAKDDIQEVIEGLQQPQKSLPPRYFYDGRGSQLFEAICQLPEYYPTRTEAGILKQYAQEIVDRTQATELVELGSGSSTKTRYLFDAYQSLSLPLTYVPVDVSGSMLSATAEDLLKDYSRFKIWGKVATYDLALQQLGDSTSGRRAIAFLGSSIGNFNAKQCDRFLEEVSSALNPGDYFLLGIDLQKSAAVLEAAYNDEQGVTAAFNLNMLQHLNDRFEGDFCPNNFQHQAVYNQDKHQIEMYLVSQEAQTVNLKSLNLTVEFKPQEKILTEISRKFNLQEMDRYLGKRQLEVIQTYTDEQKWFGLLLCQFDRSNATI